jgi:hypothetical protein
MNLLQTVVTDVATTKSKKRGRKSNTREFLASDWIEGQRARVFEVYKKSQRAMSAWEVRKELPDEDFSSIGRAVTELKDARIIIYSEEHVNRDTGIKCSAYVVNPAVETYTRLITDFVALKKREAKLKKQHLVEMGPGPAVMNKIIEVISLLEVITHLAPDYAIDCAREIKQVTDLIPQLFFKNNTVVEKKGRFKELDTAVSKTQARVAKAYKKLISVAEPKK